MDTPTTYFHWGFILISTPNLLATVMHTLFDVGTLRVARGVPSNLVRLIEDHPPIRELF